MRVFEAATEKPYGHLVIDLKQDSSEQCRLRPNVIKDAQSVQFPSTMDQPTCIDCAILFASPMDVARHRKQGCTQEELEPPCKVPKPDFIVMSESSDSESEDESLWVDLLNKTFGSHDKDYTKKVLAYESEGLSEEKARSRADRDLRKVYRSTLMKKYGSFLKLLASLQRSKLHRRILDDLNTLAEKYSIDKALTKVLKKNRGVFDVLIKNTEVESSDESLSDSDNTGEDESDDDKEASSNSDAEVSGDGASKQESSGEETGSDGESENDTEDGSDD